MKKTKKIKVAKPKKTATKIKANKTKVAKSKEVANVLGIEGPVLIFPERDVQSILTKKEYEAQIGMMGDISPEDKTFFKHFKFSVDKNSKILHAVSVDPCLSVKEMREAGENAPFASKHPLSVDRLTLADIEAYLKIKSMSKEWMNRHMVDDMWVYQTKTKNIWSVKDPLAVQETYISSAFDIIFKSPQAARKYLNMLKTFYKVRVMITA